MKNALHSHLPAVVRIHESAQTTGLGSVVRVAGTAILGAFALTFVAGWIAGIVVGLATRQISLILHLSVPAGHTLSWLGITAARVIPRSVATHMVLRRRLRDLAFRLRPGWWSDLLGGMRVTALAMTLVFLFSQQAGWLTGDATNANLVGAVTRLQGPLLPTSAGYENAIVLDWAAFVILSIVVWLWMIRRPELSET